MSTFAAIIAAAGQSKRFRDPNYKKPFVVLDQKAVWLHSAERFLNRDDVKQVIVVIAAEDQEDFFSKFGPNLAILGIDVVAGGRERADSVQNALAKVDSSVDFVAIHDAARPCVTDEEIEKVFRAAEKTGAAILATPITSTIKQSADGQKIQATVSRQDKWLAQTPQVFRLSNLQAAFQNRDAARPTDEAELMEKAGMDVTIVTGSVLNIKITTKQDLQLAKAVLKVLPKPKLDAPTHPFADDHLWR